MFKAHVIVGANLGDEGKGRVTAEYVKESKCSTLNVLTNGGSQRAHTVITPNGPVTFKHYGSGTAFGADNYFSRHFILNPMQYVMEGVELASKLVPRGIVYRNPFCRWSTPYDVMANQIIEEMRDSRHGSCGMGIWETVLRYRKGPYMTFDMFMNLDYQGQIDFMKKIRDYYINERIGSEIPQKWKEVFYSMGIIENFISDCIVMRDSTDVANDDILNYYGEVFLENGQGLMLSDTGADIGGTTPSLTGSDYAMDILQTLGANDITIHYVTRPYMTRHGYGHLDGETKMAYVSSQIVEDEFNHWNEFQGGFRYAELDIEQLKKRISDDFRKYDSNVTGIVELTHCDEMDRMVEFRKHFMNVKGYGKPQ